jgi:hypothetical protein
MNIEEKEALFIVLKQRFEKNMHLHENLTWDPIEQKLRENEEALESLFWMEQTEGEPDVIDVNENGEYLYVDCAKESPKGRRGICFDEEARLSRKKFPPEQSVEGLMQTYQVDILTEEDYRKLQILGEFDLKTSSWVATPGNIRQLGGALFCDRRYNTVFVYHNGADSYYGSRAFRAKKLV